jgi:glycosyltransferase involved in cell wall biosynthesis/peptidoglycan/xylan/chitin deacetylase (PgdA/CDA1 family)
VPTLANRVYYRIKPYVPWAVRIRARRALARHLRQTHAATWPIDPRAARSSPGWNGWPDGKKFGVVLSHDVEGPEGLEKCRALAAVEQSLGFRSVFNFVPEGSYRVPAELRRWLTDEGFEVGVHDLHHDGLLFSSPGEFADKAKRINGYLRDWSAAGFRAGFMFRNLDWYHQLEVNYDASTFDTDPFEPQADGAGTIFPFWVRSPANNGRPGYVELPYTLPQDSTLFLVLRERSPAIWLRKLDWVAQNGGLVMVNVHPDYVRFDGEPASASTYPVAHYRALLEAIRNHQAGPYWHPLPRDLAAWYRSTRPAEAPRSAPAARLPVSIYSHPQPHPPTLRGKRAAVILYSNYPSDPRPRRAAEAMIEAGMSVDLLCLSASPSDPAEETVQGVRVFRHPMQRRRDGIGTYLWQYARFFLAAFSFLTRRSLSRPYDVVHVHNMPDFLVFSALLPRLQGSRILLDLHDPSPELMQTIYRLRPGHLIVRVLRLIEKASIGFSHLVLTPNVAFRRLFASRSCDPEKIALVMNAPQPEIFSPDRFPAEAATGAQAEFRVMHHGLIAHRHGVDLLVEAIAQLRPRIPGIRLDLYGGETPFLPIVLETARRLGVADAVHYHGPKSQAEIAVAIRECHVGVVPNRRSVFTEINFPTRLFEYLALQRPVIAPSTEGIRDYFGPEDLYLFSPNDVASLASQIEAVHRDPAAVPGRVARGLAVYREHRWEGERDQLLRTLAGLLPAGT